MARRPATLAAGVGVRKTFVRKTASTVRRMTGLLGTALSLAACVPNATVPDPKLDVPSTYRYSDASGGLRDHDERNDRDWYERYGHHGADVRQHRERRRRHHHEPRHHRHGHVRRDHRGHGYGDRRVDDRGDRDRRGDQRHHEQLRLELLVDRHHRRRD